MKKHTSSRKRKTVVVSLWVKPEHQKLHIHHAVLLQPIIEQAIAQRMAAISTRLSSLLVRGVLDTGQVRRLVINLLARQPGMTPETLEEIIDGSQEGSRKQITHLTPQLTSLIEEVEKWLLQSEDTGSN